MRKHCGSKIESERKLFVVAKQTHNCICKGAKIQKDDRKTKRTGLGFCPGCKVPHFGLIVAGFWPILNILGILS